MNFAKLAASTAFFAVAFASAGPRAASTARLSDSIQNRDVKQKHEPINGFYIVTLAVAPPPDDSTPGTADGLPAGPTAPTNGISASPQWRDTIVDVAQDGTGIRIREIAIEPAVGPHCPAHAVIARERDRSLPGESIDQAAGHHHLCSMNESEVAGVIGAANKDDVARGNSDDFATQTIVATCGESEHLFELPYPDTLKWHALGLADTHITALWKLSREVVEHAFGDAPFLSDLPDAATEHPKRAPALSPADDLAAQTLAEKLVPEIRGKRYESGFGDSNCAYASCRDHTAAAALQGYTGVLDPATCAAPSAGGAVPAPSPSEGPQ
jgi:hypothetical protein